VKKIPPSNWVFISMNSTIIWRSYWGKEASESLLFPSILRNFRTVNVEMKSFQTMLMHICFLGIEKSLIALISVLANRIYCKQIAAWYNLINAIQESQ
jgi:hypothetical protein